MCSTGFEDAIPLGCYCSSTEQCLFEDNAKCIGKWPDTSECTNNKTEEACNNTEKCSWHTSEVNGVTYGNCWGKEDELESSLGYFFWWYIFY